MAVSISRLYYAPRPGPAAGGQVLGLKAREFVIAARMLDMSESRILQLPFLEPPGRLWAAYTPPTRDPRLGLLAGGLLVAYVAIQATPWGQASFDLSPLPLASVALIAGTTIVWLLLLQAIWRARLLDRMLGLSLTDREAAGPG